MTDPNLFSDPTPTASAVDARAAAGNAVTGDPVTGTAVTGDPTAVLTPGDHTTATRPPAGEPADREQIELGVAGVVRWDMTPGTAAADILASGAPASGRVVGFACPTRATDNLVPQRAGRRRGDVGASARTAGCAGYGVAVPGWRAR